ncbi:MAG: GTPase Era [Bacteroidales bacterium]|nr:GTPase Era [Bacteroidales bacterium]
MSHKAGFVNIIGKPNVGKSTLMNELVGEKLSIITAKKQTTRHRILGIVNEDDYQVIFSDTPGYLKPGYKLQESMMKFVNDALLDADIFLYITAADERDEDDEVVEKLQRTEVPVIVVINKIDLSNQERLEALVAGWRQKLPAAEIIPLSALHKFNIDTLFHLILQKLPENPPYYPKDELTNKTMRFFVSEIIREKIFLYYHQELPYSAEVIVDAFKEEENIIKIMAWIFVLRESQKGIILGKEGKAIKKMATEARKDIEEFVDKKVFLELRVKVNKDWRDDENKLKHFGYD